MTLFKLSLLSASILLSQQAFSLEASDVTVKQLMARTIKLEQALTQLKRKQEALPAQVQVTKGTLNTPAGYISTPLSVHTLAGKQDDVTFSPSALMAGDYVLTYIAGMPVVTSPYLGQRPAFDGSDFITNISSINQDVRLMMHRNAVSRGLKKLGYPQPNSPILALSGAIEPVTWHSKSYAGNSSWDMDLGTAKLDIAAALNSWVEGYFSFSYDSSPPAVSGSRVSNSSVRLGKGFVNIGNLDHSPVYFTAGQLYVPFGRYSSSMISAPIPMGMARTMARTMIVGFRHQQATGLYGAAFGFKSDTTNCSRATYGVNLGYDFNASSMRGEVGISLMNSMNEAGGMQSASGSAGQFAGFGASASTEAVNKVPAIDLHANVNVDAFGFSAEWVSATQAFRQVDLSFNQRGAKPQSINIEGAYTFKLKNKPASTGVDYGWSRQSLALGLPHQRVSAVFNVSMWRDTVQSIEVRHDMDYGTSDQAAGAGSTVNRVGSGKSANTVTAQLGVYF